MIQLEQLSSCTIALESNLRMWFLKLNNDGRVLISLGSLFHNLVAYSTTLVPSFICNFKFVTIFFNFSLPNVNWEKSWVHSPTETRVLYLFQHFQQWPAWQNLENDWLNQRLLFVNTCDAQLNRWKWSTWLTARRCLLPFEIRCSLQPSKHKTFTKL